MAAEFIAQGRQETIAQFIFFARRKTGKQRCGEHLRRGALVDGRFNRSPTFTTISDFGRILIQRRIAGQSVGPKIQQP